MRWINRFQILTQIFAIIFSILICEMFLFLFEIYSYKIIFLITLELLEIFISCWLLSKKIVPTSRKKFYKFFILGIALVNAIVIGLFYIDEKEIIIDKGAFLFVYVFLLAAINIIFIRKNKLTRVNLIKMAVISFMSILLALCFTLLRTKIIWPNSNLLFGLIVDYRFKYLIKYGLLIDYTVFYELLLLISIIFGKQCDIANDKQRMNG